MTLVALTLETALVGAQTLTPIVAAIQTQIDRDFAPAWGAAAELRLIPRGGALPSGCWTVRLLDRSDQAGDLGYHEDDGGNPESRIFVADVERYAASLSVTLSHEILEMLADPLTTRVFPLPDGRSAACEVCDPVEDDNLGYPIGGVQVSDFVTPAYFGQSSGPLDFQKHLAGVCPTLTAGGYQLVYDPASEAWNTITARRADGSFGWRFLRRGRGWWRARA